MATTCWRRRPSTGVIPTLWTSPVDNYVERLWISGGQRVENSGRTLAHPQGPPGRPRTPHSPCVRQTARTRRDAAVHRIHRTYYYDVPIYLENTKQVVGAPRAAGSNTARPGCARASVRGVNK